MHALAVGTMGVTLAALPLAALSASPLDGTAFIVEWGPTGQPADEKDDLLTFHDGRFHSAACDKYGFGKGVYQATPQGGAVVFTAATVSEKHGRLVWTGRIEGSTIEGTIVQHRKPWLLNPNPEPRDLWFRGRLRK
jgi:hypothetical protein